MKESPEPSVETPAENVPIKWHIEELGSIVQSTCEIDNRVYKVWEIGPGRTGYIFITPDGVPFNIQGLYGGNVRWVVEKVICAHTQALLLEKHFSFGEAIDNAIQDIGEQDD